jgi:hypothetical protein
MANPSLSASREALSEILSGTVTGATAANIYAEIEEVHSSEQLELSLGASVSFANIVSIATSFDFDREESRSRHLVRFMQSYYTVDVDQPSRPSDLFGPEVTVDDLRPGMGAERPPAYVSSVTYGRMVLFTFESEYSAHEMRTALEFAFNFGLIDTSLDTSVGLKEMLSRSKMTAYVLGGSGAVAAQSIDGYEKLMEFIRSGGDYSLESPGAPIAYKLSYLADNAPVRLSLTKDYVIRTCERVSQRIKVTLESIHVVDAGKGARDYQDVHGRIWAEAKTVAELFEREVAFAVRIDEGEVWPRHELMPLAEEVIEVDPHEGAEVRLRLDLWDDSRPGESRALGDIAVHAPYELGWRREATAHLTGSQSDVVVTFELQPI